MNIKIFCDEKKTVLIERTMKTLKTIGNFNTSEKQFVASIPRGYIVS